MLLPKNSLRLFIPLVLIFSSFWIYKIIEFNFFIALIVIISTLLILLKSKSLVFVIGSIAVLSFIQIQTTHLKSLTNLDNDEQRVQVERIRSYPPIFIPVFSKVIWLKPAHWIEENKGLLVLSNIERNFFDVCDFNKYFFAGFPRNNNSDFPKFVFIFIPIFIYGFYLSIKEKNKLFLAVLFFVPAVSVSIAGVDNPLGPFALFPFFIYTMTEGIENAYKLLKIKYEIFI